MTVNSVTTALFTWHALKLTWQNVFLTTNQILCFPCIERRSHSPRQKLFSFHITNEIFGLSAVRTTPSLARLVRDTWEWTAHFCTSYRHLKLARKNSRLVSSPASHHGLAKSIISSDFRAVFYSFSLRDNLYLESHSIRRVACFWHDEKRYESFSKSVKMQLFDLSRSTFQSRVTHIL